MELPKSIGDGKLLDSIIEEVDDKAHILAEQKKQQAQKEKNLRSAAENI